MSSGLKLVVIPDAQVKPDVPTDHLLAAGNYIVEHKPDVVVVLGDWYDMESLSVFNSKKQVEGQRIKADLEAGHDACDLFMRPIKEYNHRQARNKKKQYKPRLVFITGNHDPAVRIPRYIEAHPTVEGLLDADAGKNYFKDYGFEVYDFLEIVDIGGIKFSHYFINPHSAICSPLTGSIDNMLKNAGFSFVQGHSQGLKMGKHYLADGTQRLGIVAGSFYQHDEDYMNKQGNKAHWRGIIQLNRVQEGSADIVELSLEYLMEKYL